MADIFEKTMKAKAMGRGELCAIGSGFFQTSAFSLQPLAF
jgi:hypothetical protein